MEERTPTLFELDRPLRDRGPDNELDVEPYRSQLEDLQGNILKSHGRGAAVHVFLTFRDGKQADAKEFLREFEDQFEYLQGLANKASDPIIGQPADRESRELEFPEAYGKRPRKRLKFQSFVKMKGGEYFFVPSISFLRNLR